MNVPSVDSGPAAELVCSRCGRRHDIHVVHGLCDCGGPLLVEYDLDRIRLWADRDEIRLRKPTMWRYLELLPIAGDEDPVSLGEGFTPLVPAHSLAAELGVLRLWIKDDGQNPTGTFKARGAACGISAARQFGVRDVALPTAGNAGAAWACYGAAAGIAVHVVMPADAPPANRLQCELFGADVRTIDGTISDAAAVVAEGAAREGWLDVAGMKEPYRVEGKKTFALEIAEQLGWRLPDAIIYPTGGGIGLIGMWRGFRQLLDLGWLRGDATVRPPRLYAVQSEGCAPIVRAIAMGAAAAEPWIGARTIASGLRVPSALGHELTLRAIRDTGGSAVAVPDAEMLVAMGDIARATGVLASPEGAATLAGARHLVQRGDLGPKDRVVLVNTGSGLLYPDALAAAVRGGREGAE